MKMDILYSECKFCTCCMEEHEVKSVRVIEHTNFKGVPVDYEAEYFYCDTAEELYMNENQIRCNNISMKDAYKRGQGLLTSKEIIDIRKKYSISQRDFCMLLGWGGKTITRYESYQVQDKAHDTILKKISNDPEWFLNLLEGIKDKLTGESYKKYLSKATALYERTQDAYLRKAIEAKYAPFYENQMFHGNTPLSLDKVVDTICYFAASSKVINLYKVKLMKLLWYADALSYKKRGHSITGLIYQALPMGAVPIEHNSIISLKNVPCEEVDMGEAYAYRFSLRGEPKCVSLTDEDKMILDIVIDKLGRMTKDEIVAFMHREDAYIKTAPRSIISFIYTDTLQI